MPDASPAAAVPSGPDRPSDEPVVARRRGLGTAVKVGFGLLVVAFAAYYVASRWSELIAALRTARPGWVVLSVVFAAIGQWLVMLGFRSVLQAAADGPLPVLPVARVHFVSQLGKYVPGSVWSIVAVTSMARRFGIERRAAATAGILALLFSLATGAVIGAVLTVAGAASHTPALWWLLAVPVAAIALVHPRVITPVIDRLMRVLRREPVKLVLNGSVLRGALGWPALSWLFMGLQCWALVVALHGSMWSSLAGSVGGFALAYTAGTLFVPAPAGAGVREAVLTVALATVVADSSSFDKYSVAVVVLVSRVLLAFLDFGQAGFVTFLDRRRSGRPVPVA